MSFKQYLLLIPAFFVFQLCHAQEAEKTITVNKYFHVFNVIPHNGDTSLAYVYSPIGTDLLPGSSGKIIGSPVTDSIRAKKNLGIALVNKRLENKGFYVVFIINNHPERSDSTYQVQSEDVAYLPVTIKATKTPSVFRKLDLWGIIFTNNDAKYFTTPASLLNRDDKYFEDSLLNVMATEMRQIGQKFATSTDPQYNRISQTGRFKGKTLIQAFLQTTPADVKNFLYYALAFPGGYYGRTQQLNRMYGSWVYADAPESAIELYSVFASLIKNTALLKKKVEEYRKMLVKDELFTSITSFITETGDDGNTNEALIMFNNIAPVVKQLNVPLLSGNYYISKAQLLQDIEEYRKALPVCDSGISVLRNTTDPDNLYYQCMVKKAYLLRAQRDYKKAIAHSLQTEKELNADRQMKDSAQVYAIKIKIFRDRGGTYYEMEDNEKAIESFRAGEEACKKINSFESLDKQAEFQGYIAKVYKKQNRHAEAERMYRQLNETYSKQAAASKVVETIANIASLQSKQGIYTKAIQNYNTAVRYYSITEEWDLAGYYVSQTGQCYWSLGQYDSAIEAHNKALQLQYKMDNKEYKAYAWAKLGSLYSLSGFPDKALNAQDSALYYTFLNKDSITAIDYLVEIADTYAEKKDEKNALGNYQKAVDIANKLNSKSGLLQAQYNLAGYYFSRDTAKAFSLYNKAEMLATLLGDKEKQAIIYLDKALLLSRQLKYSQTEYYFNKAFAIASKEKDYAQTALCYKYLGGAAVERLRYDSAIWNYTRSIQLYDSIANRQKLPEIYQSLGQTYIELSDYEKSYKELNTGLQYAKENKNETDKASIYSVLSYLYLIQGDNSNAKIYLDSADVIAKKTENEWLQADMNISYGNYYSGFFENEKAIHYYTLADNFYKAKGNVSGRLTCLNNIGDSYLKQRNNDRALQYMNEAMELASASDIVNDVVLLLKLNASECWFRKKEYPKALALATECEKLSLKFGAIRRLLAAQELQGMISFAKGDYKNARILLNKAISGIMRNKNIARAASPYLFLARVAKEEKKYDEAFTYIQKAKSGYEYAESENGLWEVYYEMGNVYFLQNNNDSAIANYKRAVDIVTRLSVKLVGTEEEKNKLKAEETKADLFNKLIAACAKANRVDDAVYFTNLANLQGIKEKNAGAGITASNNKEQEEIDKANDILQRKNVAKDKLEKEQQKPEGQQNPELVETLVKIIKTAEEDYENYIDDLADKYDNLKAGFAESVNPQKFTAYKSNIPDSVACLLYIIDQKQLFIFTVTNKETKAFTVELNFNLDSLVNSLRLALKIPQSKFSSGPLLQRSLDPDEETPNNKVVDFNNVAAKLYAALVKPVAEVIENKKTLCIIPTGRLSLIPFQVLSYKKNNVPRFLLEDYEIFYTNQLEVFYDKTAGLKKVSGLAAFGNPDKTLPNSEKEVNNLKDIFGSEQYYLQDAATETQARQSLIKDKYIHFATHGVLDYNDFRNSYLVFSPVSETDPAQNGQLTIREIKSLKIEDCELVTLSACESGVNKEISKGWYISPANSFLVKGVKTVVASLWKVHDEATSFLMTEFYKNLSTMSKAQALRHAQIALTQNPKYQHPYYWAPFLLYGHWQ